MFRSWAAFLMASSALAQTGHDPLRAVQSYCLELQRSNPIDFSRISISLTCDSVSYYWAPLDTQPTSLPSRRLVSSRFRTISFEEPPLIAEHSIAPVTVDCPRFKLMERRAFRDVQFRCSEVLRLHDVDALCNTLLEQTEATDANAVEVLETGTTFTPCAGAVPSMGPSGTKQRN